ncbi:hypothetical protein ACVI3U_002772 [Sinorhizobium medicae]
MLKFLLAITLGAVAGEAAAGCNKELLNVEGWSAQSMASAELRSPWTLGLRPRTLFGLSRRSFISAMRSTKTSVHYLLNVTLTFLPAETTPD